MFAQQICHRCGRGYARIHPDLEWLCEVCEDSSWRAMLGRINPNLEGPVADEILPFLFAPRLKRVRLLYLKNVLTGPQTLFTKLIRAFVSTHGGYGYQQHDAFERILQFLTRF